MRYVKPAIISAQHSLKETRHVFKRPIKYNLVHITSTCAIYHILFEHAHFHSTILHNTHYTLQYINFNQWKIQYNTIHNTTTAPVDVVFSDLVPGLPHKRIVTTA